MTDPVKESPTVPSDDSGTLPRHDTQEMPVTKRELKRSFRINEVYTVVVAIVTAAIAVIIGYRIFVSEARAAGVEEAKKAREEIVEIRERQKDQDKSIRDLYFAVMYRQRSEWLEREPLEKDGGK